MLILIICISENKACPLEYIPQRLADTDMEMAESVLFMTPGELCQYGKLGRYL